MPNDEDFDLSADLDSLSLDDFSLDDDLTLPGDDDNSDGVWVKTAPEDFEDPIESESLSSEELDKIGSDFDLVVASDTPLEGESLEDDFDEISLDDFVNFEDDADPSGGVKPDSFGLETEIPTEAENKEVFLDIDISIEDEVDDRELEIIEGAQVRRDSFETETIPGAEEVDLSEFSDVSFDSSIGGVAIESFGSDSEALEELDLEDFGIDTSSTQDTTTEMEELSEISPPETPTSSDVTVQDIEVDDSEMEEPFFELGNESDFSDDFESLLSHEKDQGYDITVEPAEPDMESIQALEDDLTSGIKEQENSAARGSESILLKIEQELLSIKAEITSLKSEVTQLKSLPPKSTPDGLVTEESSFFTDDEDEVIALTGDELDNILSSAEITEEITEEDNGSDLITTDSLGEILEDTTEYAGENESQSDVDLFSGTELEDSLGDEIHVPDTELTSPIPGAKDIVDSSIPEELDLEPLDAQEIQNVLSSEEEAFPEISSLDLSVDDIELESTSLNDLDYSQEISFDLEDQDADMFMETESRPDLEESTLEIPLDEDMMESIEEGVEDPAWDMKPQEELSTPVVPREVPITEAILPEPVETPVVSPGPTRANPPAMNETLKEEIRTVLSYMDKLLENLPDEKIKEFADSEHFEVYKKLFEELGLTE